MKLTEASVARATLPLGLNKNGKPFTDYQVFDDDMPGFGLRIRTGGHKSFLVKYKIGKLSITYPLGKIGKVTLAAARKNASIIFAKIKLGQNPAAEKDKARAQASDTLGSIVAAYLEAKKDTMRPRSYAATKYHLETVWKPLHGQAVATLSRATIAAQVRTIAKASGPAAANRARASLSAMFRWAIGEGLAEENPVVGTNKQEENGPRERALSDAEAAAVWLAATDNDYGRIVRLALLTGCRRTELGDLQWPEIDLEARTITLPKERTKNGQEHIVPLCDAALEILKAIPHREGRDFVFGTGTGGYSGWSKAKAMLDKTAKLKEPWTLHDLRRTVRTGFGTLGVLPHVAEAALNHLPPKLIRTYDRNSYAKEIKAALDLWAGHLAVAVAQANGANVTRLQSRK